VAAIGLHEARVRHYRDDDLDGGLHSTMWPGPQFTGNPLVKSAARAVTSHKWMINFIYA
jgi:hypothetical protein